MSSGNIFSIDTTDQLLKNVQSQLTENTGATDPKDTSPLAASSVLISDASGKIISASETSAELTSAVNHTSSTSNPHTVTKAQLSLDTTDDVEFGNDTVITKITTNGDSDLDDVTLADGTLNQIKMFVVETSGNAADSVKITPANMIGGTQITFAADPVGKGCTMMFATSGWIVVSTNGGVVA